MSIALVVHGQQGWAIKVVWSQDLMHNSNQLTGKNEMADVSDTIPAGLQTEVDAAISWFNTQQDDTFEVTGIVDAQKTLATPGPKKLQLVLCGGDTCQQKSFNVVSAGQGFDVSLAVKAAAPTQRQAELDPPPGARNQWLDSVLNKHKFVVLVFYRGFW